jgi:PAS domain-containing protein
MTSTVLHKLALHALGREDRRGSAAEPVLRSLNGSADRIPGILWTTDKDLRFNMLLGAGLAQLGLQPRDLAGQTLHDFFKTDDPEFPPIAAHQAALAGVTQSFAFLPRDIGLSSDHCAAYCGCVAPYFDSNGQLLGTVAMIRRSS